MFNRMDGQEKERERLEKSLHALRKRRLVEEAGKVEQVLAGKVPPKLESTLNLAFAKAFTLVFSKGEAWIAKSSDEDLLRAEFQVRAQSAQKSKKRGDFQRLGKRSLFSRGQHLLFAGIEGGILGILGIGLPDIPLFLGVLVRNLREIALSFGITPEGEAERVFLLRIMEIALLRGQAFVDADLGLQKELEAGVLAQIPQSVQEKETGEALSRYLLYLKFLQGIPLVGIVGGMSDVRCLHRVTQYATLQYRKRFLLGMDKISLP